MNFESVVKKRRMCREYLDRDVPQEKVNRILDLASRYPSAGHTEPQELIMVRDRRVKEDLARTTKPLGEPVTSSATGRAGRPAARRAPCIPTLALPPSPPRGRRFWSSQSRRELVRLV